jgi:phosphoglucomutase
MADPRAGTLAQPSDLVDVAHLVTAYYTLEPDPDDVDQQVAFGTSGHRGSSLDVAFNEVHIAATTQAICDYRQEQGYDGPLLIGRDPHALSEPAWATAIEVLVANDVEVWVDDEDGYTPTPAVSALDPGAQPGPDHRQRPRGRDRGHAEPQPPVRRGLQVQPAHGGPADTDATKVIAARANELIRANLEGVRRIAFARARKACVPHAYLGSTSQTSRTSWTSTPSGTPECASAPIRWAGRACLLGSGSPMCIAST